MRKLIATQFRYTALDALGNRQEHAGSYLGRKPATRATLRRFLNANGGRERRPRLVSIDASWESPWIAK